MSFPRSQSDSVRPSVTTIVRVVYGSLNPTRLDYDSLCFNADQCYDPASVCEWLLSRCLCVSYIYCSWEPAVKGTIRMLVTFIVFMSLLHGNGSSCNLVNVSSYPTVFAWCNLVNVSSYDCLRFVRLCLRSCDCLRTTMYLYEMNIK